MKTRYRKCYRCGDPTKETCESCDRPVCFKHEDCVKWEDALICDICGPALRKSEHDQRRTA